MPFPQPHLDSSLLPISFPRKDLTMNDPTEAIRRERLAEINSAPNERESLEEKYGQVWDTQELTQDFTVEGFLAPFVVVRRKCDGQVGSLEFQHEPRFYFNFIPDNQ